jgi:hypothetical protein
MSVNRFIAVFHVAGNSICPSGVQNEVIGGKVNYRTKWLN